MEYQDHKRHIELKLKRPLDKLEEIIARLFYKCGKSDILTNKMLRGGK